MSMPVSTGDCSDPRLRERLTGFCFDGPDAESDPQLEAHLLECDGCWDELQRLERAVRHLRADEPLTRRILAKDLVALIGISARLDRPLAGHSLYALLTCLGLGVLYGLALISEVAYDFDRLGNSAVLLAVLLTVVVTSLGLTGLALDARRTRAGRHDGLTVSILMFTAAAGLVFLCVWPFLPAEPIVRASFQTFTARAGMLKAICYFLPLSIAFVCIPFHFVVAMQRELSAGRWKLTMNVLVGQGLEVLPKGTVFPGVRLLGAALSLVGAVAVYGLSHLFERLTPAPYMNLFMLSALARTALFFVVGLGCVWWYSRCLNELTREAIGAETTDSIRWLDSVH